MSAVTIKTAPADVSICIPAFNTEPYIGETLGSLIRQQGIADIFVSDNASTDGTVAVANKFSDAGVKVVNFKATPELYNDALDNCRKAAANWNSLVALGVGEYIALYHSDDVYGASIVELESEFLRRNKHCSAVFTLGQPIDQDGGPLPIHDWCLRHWIGTEKCFDYESLMLALMRWGCFLQAPTAMIRRSAWIQSGGLTTKYEQACDVDWWLRLAKIGPIGVIGQKCYRNRITQTRDSANGATLYRYRMLPFYRLLDDLLIVSAPGICENAEYSDYQVYRLSEEYSVALEVWYESRVDHVGRPKTSLRSLRAMAIVRCLILHPKKVAQLCFAYTVLRINRKIGRESIVAPKFLFKRFWRR